MKQIQRAELKTAVLLLTLGIAFGACEDRYDVEPNPLAALWFLSAFSSTTYYTPVPAQSELEDLGDGTVRFTMTPRQTIYYTETEPRVRYRVLLRKCPQGFLYDAATNTCSVDPALGGTDPNLAKLQYCDTAGNDCNDLDAHLNGVGNSEMFNSCASETAADLNWRGAYHYTLERLTTHADFATVYPDLKAQWVFSELAHSTGAAYAFRSDIGEGSRSKTDKSFVLCEYQLSDGFPRR